MQRNAFDPAWMRRRLVLTLVVSIAVANSFIIFADGESKSLLSNWTVNVAAAGALGISVAVVWRQKLDGLNGRTYAAFTIGLALWFVAEILWAYYTLGAGIVDPFPSLADAFWIAGYAAFAYHLMATYKFFGKVVRPHVILTVSVAAAVFVGHTSIVVLEAAAPITMPEDFADAAISVAYIVLDAVLIVPAIMVLASLWHGKLTFTPWIILASSLIIVAAADSGFAYYQATGLAGEIWVWDLLYSTSYIAMAAALFWHYRFFIYHEKKVRKIWQEENR